MEKEKSGLRGTEDVQPVTFPPLTLSCEGQKRVHQLVFKEARELLQIFVHFGCTFPWSIFYKGEVKTQNQTEKPQVCQTRSKRYIFMGDSPSDKGVRTEELHRAGLPESTQLQR